MGVEVRVLSKAQMSKSQKQIASGFFVVCFRFFDGLYGYVGAGLVPALKGRPQGYAPTTPNLRKPK